MNIPVYTLKGTQPDSLDLPEPIFGIEENKDLVYQAAQYYANNRRQALAHTKGRGDVSGGGKKPWRQKGTGRARHGSTRSPIWVGGGVAFGPKSTQVFSQKLNKKMRRKALFAVLSEKLRRGQIILIDTFELENAKTKTLAAALDKLPVKDNKTLLVLPKMDKSIIKAAENLPSVETIQARDLNAFDVLRFPFIVLSKEAVNIVKGTFLEGISLTDKTES